MAKGFFIWQTILQKMMKMQKSVSTAHTWRLGTQSLQSVPASSLHTSQRFADILLWIKKTILFSNDLTASPFPRITYPRIFPCCWKTITCRTSVSMSFGTVVQVCFWTVDLPWKAWGVHGTFGYSDDRQHLRPPGRAEKAAFDRKNGGQYLLTRLEGR